MKRLIDLLVLIFISVHIYAQEQPELKYNLKKGDEFYYLVDKTETAVKGNLHYYNEKVSNSRYWKWRHGKHEKNKYWLKFKVLEKRDSSCKMEMVFTRIRFELEDYVYDSDTIHKITDYEIRLKQYLIGESITFDMNNYGEIGEFKISDEFYSNVFSHRDSKGLMKNLEIKNHSIVSYDNLNEIVKTIFCPLSGKNRSNWSKKLSVKSVFPEIEYKYSVNRQKNLAEIELKSEYNNRKKDIMKVAGWRCIPMNYKTKGRFIFNKELCELSEIKGVYGFNYLGKHKILFSLKTKRIEPDTNSSRIFISGRVSKSLGIKSIHLYDGGYLKLQNGDTVNVSRQRKEYVLRLLRK